MVKNVVKATCAHALRVISKYSHEHSGGDDVGVAKESDTLANVTCLDKSRFVAN